MKIPGTKIKERLSISDCFSWDVTLCSPLHWYHTTLYHSIQNNLVYLESHPRNTKSSSFYSPYRITLRSETVRPLQYGAETKEKRLTAGEETVSNARRLYVVPGTGGGSPSHIWFTQLATREHVIQVLPVDLHTVERTNKWKMGPGMYVIIYIRVSPSLTQLDTKCLDMTEDRIPELTFIIYIESTY